MGRPRRVNCRGCERHIDECGPLSSRYLCEDCGEARLRANIEAMIATGGLSVARWQVGMMRAAGLDVELPEAPPGE